MLINYVIGDKNGILIKDKKKLVIVINYCNVFVLFCIIVCKDVECELKSGMCKLWVKFGYCEKVKYVMLRYCFKECKYCSKLLFLFLWFL